MGRKKRRKERKGRKRKEGEKINWKALVFASFVSLMCYNVDGIYIV